MKNNLILFVFIGLLLSCNSNSKPDLKKSSKEADELSVEEKEKMGFDAYQESPAKAISVFKEVALQFEKEKKFSKAAFTNLNIAGIYDEQIIDLDSALIFSNRSLDIWKQLNDTMQMANLYKYVGLLKGKQGLLEDAKSDIHKGIEFYKTQDFEKGVAVSHFNLANIYFLAKDYENSLKYYTKSKEFWLSIHEKGRVFDNNVLGIKIYSALKMTDEMKALIK